MGRLGGVALHMALTKVTRFSHQVAWRVPADFAHVSGASAETAARLAWLAL